MMMTTTTMTMLMTKSYSDDNLIHQPVYVGSFELGLAAVHHQLGVSSGEQHQTVAPGGVTQHAASQQDLLIVQRVRLVLPRQRALKLAEVVVRRLADHFAYRSVTRASFTFTSHHIIIFIITTRVFSHSFTLSFHAEDLPVLQLLSTTDVFSPAGLT